MTDWVGQQLDNYRLVRLLGAGGFGEVYLAEHLYRSRQVAIKILPQLAQYDLHSFLTEARTFRLKHPNIVQILDFGVEGRTPFIVMEYAPNGTLRKLHPKGMRVPLPTIVSYVKQVASALQYAHDERLIHRDVKPENMLIGVENRVLLSDFGIATIAHGTSSQSVETMAGTIPYMAPEQIQAHPRPASDQYSLGVVVYEWLCGDRPFHGTLTEVVVKHATVPPPSLQEKVPTISPDVEQVVTTALAKDPKQRFGSVLAFATALERASQTKQPEPVPVIPVSETKEMATPVPVIPFSQQTVGEVPADTPAQPHTITLLSGMERLRQAEAERHQAEEERARQEKEQANKIEEERVRNAKETALAATELASSAHQTPLPTEVAHSSKPPPLRPDAMVVVKPAKPSASRRFALLGLAGLVIVALASGIAGFTILHAPQAGSNTSSTSSSRLKAGPGVDLTNKTITLGILSPYSGPVADPIGKPLARGAEVFFDSINDNGVVDGFKVKFLEEDTQYNPQIEVQLYNKIHNQVLMIAASLGSHTTFAIKDLATQDHMLVSAATLSSALAREKYLILLGTPYRLQVENAFDYVVNKLGVQSPSVGIIYQNDEYGQDGLTGYKEAVNFYHLHDVAQATYAVTDTDYTAQVSQLKAADAKYVFLTTTPTATAGIIATAYKLGYNPQWILQSPAFALALLSVPGLSALMSHAWLVSQGANWGDTSVPGMAQMMSDVQKYVPDQKPDGYFEFGYTESKITYAILKKALDNNDITRDGLFTAFESLHNVDLGGLLPPVTYGSSPNQRVPSRDSVIFAIDPKQPAGVKALSADFTGGAAQQSQF